jgi:tRNA 2-thiouridine synthesizing protein A
MSSSVQKINAMGMRCPRPIVELAKARRKSSPNDTIEITADDLAFESDLRAWCEATRCELIDLQKEGRKSTATVRIGGGS